MSSVANVITEASLHEAWERVLANDAADGVLAPSVKTFATTADERLAALASSIHDGTYFPAPLTAVEISKDDGTVRELRVSAATDRVVERAVAAWLAPQIDPWLAPTSFGYRRGTGVADAVQRTVELRDEGYVFGLRTDVDDCFDTIDRGRVLQLLAPFCPEDMIDLIALLVDRPARSGRSLTRTLRGLAQGSSLSPLLSNLFLDQFDRKLWDEGVVHLRYADDLLMLGRTATEVDAAQQTARKAIAMLDQRLGDDKTELVSFDEGFTYLGEEFGPRYPDDRPYARRSEPPSRSLYVGRQGAGVRISKGRLIIDQDETELLSVPCRHVERIVLSGAVGFSAGARSWALATGVPVTFLSRRGSLLGSLQSGDTAEAALRRSQYEVSGDEAFAVQLGRSFIRGKLLNMRALVMRYARKDSIETASEAVDAIKFAVDRLGEATSRNEIMGLEGVASRRYFEAVREIVPEELGFTGRVRRPPTDVVNSALGYGYAILGGEAAAAVAAAGLDPAAGFLHVDHDRRPSLALDLMEEFRSAAVDASVLELIRRRRLTEAHANLTDRGVLLTAKGRKLLIAQIESRLLTMFKHPMLDRRVSYRRSIHLQAQQLTRCIREADPTYEPLVRP